MIKTNLGLCLLFITAVVYLSSCKGPQALMHPDGGYPLLKNNDSIKHLLTSRCIDMIHFNEGEIIADIGAGNGYLEGMLSLSFDSLTFYVQDIDSSVCNQASVDRVFYFYKNLNRNQYHNKFIAVSGTDSTSNLPNHIFDKVLMLYTYQYIKKPEAFILDVRKKLKDDGQFYVVNPQYDKYDDLESQRKKYGWNASPLEREITTIMRCGFELVELSRHYGIQGNPYLMVFKKNCNSTSFAISQSSNQRRRFCF